MSKKTIAAAAVVLIALASMIALGLRAGSHGADTAAAAREPGGPPVRQSSSAVGTIRPPDAARTAKPSRDTAPALERNALNTPAAVLNSTNGVLVVSQDVRPLEEMPDQFADLALKLKNVSARPIAQIVFAPQREEVTSLGGLALRSADFTEGQLFQPGAEITYSFRLAASQPPLVTRVAAVVYQDATGEGDRVVKDVFASKYVAYNAELAALLADVQAAVENSRAAGLSDVDAADAFAADLRRRSAAADGDPRASAERKRVYSEYAEVIGRFGKGGDGLSAFAAKLAELLRGRATSLPQAQVP
jgi:hypothetical protein